MKRKKRRRNRLIELRVERGWRQKDVAERLGVTTSAYGMIEQGVRTPRLPLALQIEELFGVPLGELFFEEEPNEVFGQGEGISQEPA